MQLKRDLSSNASGSLQHLNTAGLFWPDQLLGCPSKTQMKHDTRADGCRTWLAQQHTPTPLQHWHATVPQWQMTRLYTISDNTPLQKIVRNSREGSSLKKRALPYLFSSTVSHEQTEENKWDKAKISSWEKVPELLERAKSKIFF